MGRLYAAVGFLLVVGLGVGTFGGRSTGQPAPGAEATHKKITVTGSATVTVKPDTARVSFGVRGTGADFKAAVADCDKKGEAVKKAIADLKLDGLEVKFGPINIAPAPVGLGGGQAAPPGAPAPAFEVTRTFTVVAMFGGKGLAGDTKDIVAVADRTLTAAVGAGATEPPVFNNNNQYGNLGFGGGGFNGGGNSRIEFSRSNVAQLRQDALKLAVADAIANAKAAGGVANLTAKDIVALSDQVQNNNFGMVYGQPTNPGRGEVLGEQELTVQVVVTFNY
jgi:uncharacterized protein YggE